MALERVPGTTTTIQPSPGTTATDVQAEIALAGTQGQSAQAGMQVADTVQTFATQVMRDETLKQAQRDAAQVVTVDDVEGKRGWGGFLYNDAYTKGAVAQYTSLAVTDAQAHAQEILTRNPNNPEAVRTELTAYLDAKKKAMPEHVSDAMTPHYTGILTGAVSSATAGAGRTNLASLESTSKAQLNGYILNYAQTLSSTAYKNSSPVARADTEATFEKTWTLIEDQMLTYMTPQAVAQVKTDARALIEANVKGAEFENRARGMSLDPVGIARLKVEADTWAKDASRAQHYGASKATLDGYIERGAGYASAVQQAVLIDQHLKVGGIQDQAAAIEVKRKNNEITKEQYDQQMKELQQQALTAGVGRMPGQKAQLVAAAGDSGPGLTQMYGSALLQASGRALYGVDRATQLQGFAEVKAIKDDNLLINLAGNNLQLGGLLQQAQKIVATQAVEAKIPDIVSLAGHLQSENINKKDLPQIYANADSAGLLGNLDGQMSRADFRRYADVGLAKNEALAKVQANNTNIMNQLRGSDTSYPQPANGEQVASLEKTNPTTFTTRDSAGKVATGPFNPNNPDHLSLGVGTVVRANYMPQVIKDWGANMSPSASPEDQTKLVNLYDQVRQVWADKYKDLPDDIKQGKIYEATRATMGDGATTNVMAFRRAPGNPDNIAKLVATENAARNLPLEEKGSYTAALIGGVQAEYSKGAPSAFTGAVMGAAKVAAGFHPLAKQGQEWLQKMEMFSNAGMAALTSSLPQFGKPPGVGTPAPGNIYIEPTALAVLNAQATGPTGYQTLYGNTWRDQNLSPHQQSLYRSLQDHPEMFSMVWSKDAKGEDRVALTYRDYRAEYNKLHSYPGIQPWDNARIMAADVSVLSAKHPYHMGQVNVDTGVYRTEVQPDGATSWSISFQNKEPGKLPLRFDIRPDDKLHDTLREDSARNLALRTDMPSFYNFIRSVPGVALADSFVAQNREAAMLQAAAGINGPGENWTAMIRNLRAGIETFTDQQIKAGNTNVQTIKPEDWAKLENPDMQKTINEMGSVYALVFGSQPQLPLLGRGRSLEPGPPEMAVPPPLSTDPNTQGVTPQSSLELQQRALESRRQASPQVRRMIENTFRPPGAPKPAIPLGPEPQPPTGPQPSTSLPLVPPVVPPKR